MVDVHHETLRVWVKKALAAGPGPSGQAWVSLSTAERDELVRLRKENRDLEQTTEVLKLVSSSFAWELDPRHR